MPQMSHYNALLPGEIIKIRFHMERTKGACLFSSVSLYVNIFLASTYTNSWALCSDLILSQINYLQLSVSFCSLEVYNFFYKILLKFADSLKIMGHEKETIRRPGKKKNMQISYQSVTIPTTKIILARNIV